LIEDFAWAWMDERIGGMMFHSLHGTTENWGAGREAYSDILDF